MKENSDLKIVEKILESNSLENKTVLEVGCGDGRITSLLANRPKQLVALDPDEDKIKEAREKIPDVDFRVGSGESLEFPDNSFDVVLFTLSLHHQDSRAALDETQRVLKNDGIALVIEPVEEGEIEQVFALLNDEREVKIQAQKAINQSGLIIIRSEIFNVEWIFEDQKELYQGLFDYYEMPYDDNTVTKMCELLGEKIEKCPIRLTDTIMLQELRKQETFVANEVR